MIGSSIIPPRDRLIKEHQYHSREYDWLLSKGHLDEYMSREDSREMDWHGDELEKLTKVLDSLYPDWTHATAQADAEAEKGE